MVDDSSNKCSNQSINSPSHSPPSIDDPPELDTSSSTVNQNKQKLSLAAVKDQNRRMQKYNKMRKCGANKLDGRFSKFFKATIN